MRGYRISAAHEVATTVSAKRKQVFHALYAHPSISPDIKCQIIRKPQNKPRTLIIIMTAHDISIQFDQ